MVACGKTKEEKKTDAAVADGNAKQQLTINTNRELSNKYDVGLLHSASTYDWSKRTPAERQEIRQKLTVVRNAATDAIAVAQRKDTKGGSAPLMTMYKESAIEFLASLDKYEKGG